MLTSSSQSPAPASQVLTLQTRVTQSLCTSKLEKGQQKRGGSKDKTPSMSLVMSKPKGGFSMLYDPKWGYVSTDMKLVLKQDNATAQRGASTLAG